MTIFSKIFLGGMAPLTPPGYAYGKNQNFLETWSQQLNFD